MGGKMSKVILEFDSIEDREELATTLKAGNMQSALWDIAQEVFRPARKHGYSDEELQALVNLSHGEELVSKLEVLFYQILEKHDVPLG